MRVLYKALTSVAMIVLSTAAAVGLRQLALSRRRKKAHKHSHADAGQAAQAQQAAAEAKNVSSQEDVCGSESCAEVIEQVIADDLADALAVESIEDT